MKKPAEKQTRLLWVFGTLMSDMGANYLLGKDAKLKCVGYLDGFDMYVAGFPRLHENATQGCKILGEVWEVSEENMPAVNRYEGVPNLFDLVKVDFDKHKPEWSITTAVNDRDLWMYAYQWSKDAEFKYIEGKEFKRVEPNLDDVVSFKHIRYFQGYRPNE